MTDQPTPNQGSGTPSSAPVAPVELKGIPTAACPLCGCTWFITGVSLDAETYEISSWMLAGASCHDCGTLVTLACPPDHPDFEARNF
jgi:hypothetical protein